MKFGIEIELNIIIVLKKREGCLLVILTRHLKKNKRLMVTLLTDEDKKAQYITDN